jgi:alpha-N-arabinofuranosidase
MGPFDVLDVSATRDEPGQTLTLVVVNRDPDNGVSTTVQLSDAAFDGNVAVYEVTGDDPSITNDFEEERVGVTESTAEAKGASFEHSFPPCSVTVLRASLAG